VTELIEDPADPRLDGYRFLREPARRRQIERDREIFVAEGLLVLEALLSSPYRLRSVLVSTRRAEAAAALLGEHVWRYLEPLFDEPPEALLQRRYDRYRYIDSLVAAAPDFGPKVGEGGSRRGIA